MSAYYVIGIRLNQRTQSSQALQTVLSKYGCNIKARIGLHETRDDFCANDGIILLHAYGDQETIQKMTDELSAIDHSTVKLMDLNNA